MDAHPNAATDVLDASGGAGDVRAPRRMATDRLVLRRAHHDDVDVDRLHALFATPADEVFELCGWDRHDDEAETRAYLDEKAVQWDRGEFFEYVLEADGEYVGTTCLERSDDESGEFGLWLRKPYWGRGYAGEVTDALVHAAFERLDAPYVIIGCRPSNDRSRRAIEKFVRRYGGAYVGSPPRVSSGEGRVAPHHEWVVTREQYESGEQGLSTHVPGVAYDDLAF